jgi:hypothetical protein
MESMATNLSLTYRETVSTRASNRYVYGSEALTDGSNMTFRVRSSLKKHFERQLCPLEALSLSDITRRFGRDTCNPGP